MFNVLSAGCWVILPPLLIIANIISDKYILVISLTEKTEAYDVCIQTLDRVNESESSIDSVWMH